MTMTIQGLIQAAGSGTRLGLGPKAFVELDGATLLERAVHLLEDVVDSVIVAVPASDVARAAGLVAGPRVRVIAGTATRSSTTRRLVAEATAPLLLLHDVVHPFADRALVARLLGKARETGAAAPGILNTEYLYDPAGVLLHAPGDLLIGQKPVAFLRGAALDGYAGLAGDGLGGDPSFLDVLEAGGVRTAFVPGDARNIKITTPGDLMLARALGALDRTEGNGELGGVRTKAQSSGSCRAATRRA